MYWIILSAAPDPNCTAVHHHVKVLNRTDSSMVLYYNGTLDLCVQSKSKEAHENECLPVGRSTVSFTSLDVATIYNFSVFSYVITSENKLLRSDSSCLRSEYTCKYIILSFHSLIYIWWVFFGVKYSNLKISRYICRIRIRNTNTKTFALTFQYHEIQTVQQKNR